jgi:nitrilase
MTLVAAIQMTTTADVGRNLAVAGALLQQARERGAGVAALPENFAFMGLAEADKLGVAEDDGAGPVQDALAGLARQLGLWIVAGTLPVRAPGEARVAAACLVFDADGRRVARYDKVHLFDVAIPGREERYQESASVLPGQRTVCVDTPAGRLGLAVCYDLRFPELYRLLGEPDLILVPAAFTATTGRAHWLTLLRARAIENLACVVGVNRIGRDGNGVTYAGDSVALDHLGQPLGSEGDGDRVETAVLDLESLQSWRRSFPAHLDADEFELRH